MIFSTKVMSASDADHTSQRLNLPRILCLHGGGTNASIFRAQCRVLKLHVSTIFRLVFAEAPFQSSPGPDVTSVYEGWAPFRSWVMLPKDGDDIGKTQNKTTNGIEISLRIVMEDDDHCGATGEWVGLLGFSQGAKIGASILLNQQMQQQALFPTIAWKFAILLAGSGPLLSLEKNLFSAPEQGDQPNTATTRTPDLAYRNRRLNLRTVHVHGLQDPGLSEHRKLLCQNCEVDSTKLMEWDGDHRIPIKTKDVLTLIKYIWEAAYETGVVNTKSVPGYVTPLIN